jgi:site-specific DNA-methyltransferase (adenine-specific)
MNYPLLFFGDCLDKMKDIPNGSIDMILADLPYGTTACKWDNVIPFTTLWFHYWRVIKENGCIALFGSEPFSSRIRMTQINHYKYDWVWKKNTVTGLASAKYRPMKDYELISIFYIKQPNYFPQKVERIWYGKKTKIKSCIRKMGQYSDHNPKMENRKKVIYDPNLVNPRMILEFNTEPNALKKLHPTQKPVKLLEYLIKTYTNENDLVLDNVMGSGSTGVACQNINRKFIGIENNKNYYDIAYNRILKCTSK